MFLAATGKGPYKSRSSPSRQASTGLDEGALGHIQGSEKTRRDSPDRGGKDSP